MCSIKIYFYNSFQTEPIFSRLELDKNFKKLYSQFLNVGAKVT